MTRFLICLLISAGVSLAQTPEPSNLPHDLVSTGLSWDRYAATAFSSITTVAIRIGTTSFYSWSTLDTPIAKTPAGQTPQPSSIRTGAAYVFAQSASGAVSAFVLGDAGMATTATTSVGQWSGGSGVAIRLGKSHWYVMPLYRIIGTSGAGVEAVPEAQLGFSF